MTTYPIDAVANSTADISLVVSVGVHGKDDACSRHQGASRRKDEEHADSVHEL